MSDSSSFAHREANPDHPQPLVEIGWIAVGGMEEADWQAVQRAHQKMLDYLRMVFPGFNWRMPLIRREELAATSREQPIELLDYGVHERNLKHWDYTIVVTSANLKSHYRPEAFAAVSRSLETVVVSTSRLDPRFLDLQVDEEERVSVMARRIKAAALHALGHQLGLGHHESPANFMHPPASLAEVGQAEEFSPVQIAHMTAQLGDIGDRRLEEKDEYRQAHPWMFYLIGAVLNRREIVSAVSQAKPWQFPYRLSRLTTAGVSAMLVLMITAEVWELAVNQSGLLVLLLSLAAVGAATAFLILRQRLFVRRERPRLSEQTVNTNLSTFIIVLLGMTVTYLLLFLIALLAGYIFFAPSLVRNWAPGLAKVGLVNYLSLSAFIASLGIFIGALGATFEDNEYFRHITFVDEEL